MKDKKNKWPEGLIIFGVLGAVMVTAFLNIYIAGYMLCAFSLGAGIIIAKFSRR